VGVVPGAGASRRMGRPKALLELAGRPFVHHVVRALAEGGCDPVLVVVAEGDDQVTEAAQDAGAQVLANPDPGEGPITSLRVAIAALDDTVPGIAYLPVDHPAVKPETVARLLAEARRSSAALTVPMYGPKRGHPGIFEASLFPELLDPSLTGGARIVVHRHLADACLVEVEDPGVVTDVDSPEAYAALVSGTSHRTAERHP
jgi:molybdenum cofactor cytidylyltransferase